ncbi:DUF7312 domain-containing protein [Natronobiforma cellulositropha]|uniref:DUF7312 domain-containing protein n=1 Tax=Natronobiforma cellulositropha TaxID=1679076 RepID=UPI0021D59674|nr:hypothetical protein [Natronobiforma cellulositropha]
MDEDASPARADERDGDETEAHDEYDRIPIDTTRAPAAAERDGETDATEDTEREGEVDDHLVPEPNSTVIEPGSPTLEGAVFVVLGVVLTVAILLRLVSIGFVG